MTEKTVLNATHRALGARMVDFGGWDMPISYGSQIEEHHAVRRDAGMFDVSHMTVIDLHGARARDFLRHLLANSIDKSPKAIRVGDYNSRKLIDAETAFWVIGGNKAGVMSSRAKWAFEKKSDAEAFIAANGGSQAGFEDALKAAYEDLYKDTRMIREKRKLKRIKQPEQK